MNRNWRWLRWFVDLTDDNSLSSGMRRRRLKLFRSLIARGPNHPLNILDVGGVEGFWKTVGFADTPHHITMLNLIPVECTHKNFSSVVGDGRNMKEFADRQFDIVFSNSVIEHAGVFEDQMRVASEIRRVSRSYFVQTPSFYFLLEPHFLFPFFQWLPLGIRVWLVCHFSLGYYPKASTREEARRFVGEIRLLKHSETKRLFPDSTILCERILGITKSYIAVRNFRTITDAVQ